MTDESGKVEQVAITEARGAMYRLLARCFYAPTPELLDDLTRGPSAALWQNLVTMFVADEQARTPAPQRDGSAVFETCREEYMRLFEGPGHMEVAPYESVHRKDVSDLERGLVMGAATLDARRRYAEAGLAIASDFTDLPDHIAVELEFMYYLCAKQAQASGGDDDGPYIKAQREFLREHFLKWLPDFCDKMEHAARVRFYRDLAKVTSAYIASEAADLLSTSAATGAN